MSLNIESDLKSGGDAATKSPPTGRNGNRPRAATKAGGVKLFRRLKPNEMVRAGDFVAGKRDSFEPWDGPAGFLADAFVMPIYRRNGSRRPASDAADS